MRMIAGREVGGFTPLSIVSYRSAAAKKAAVCLAARRVGV